MPAIGHRYAEEQSIVDILLHGISLHPVSTKAMVAIRQTLPLTEDHVDSLRCRTIARAGGSAAYAPPRPHVPSAAGGPGGAHHSAVEQDDEGEDAPLVNGGAGSLDSFFTRIESVRHDSNALTLLIRPAYCNVSSRTWHIATWCHAGVPTAPEHNRELLFGLAELLRCTVMLIIGALIHVQTEGSPKRPGTRQPGRSGIPPPLSVESDGGEEPSRKGLASWFMRGR